MIHLLSKMINEIADSAEASHIKKHTAYFIMLAPVIIMFFETIFLAYPGTRALSVWMHQENHPIEIITFLVFLMAGIMGLRLSYKIKMSTEKSLVYGFYLFFSIALLFIAMEEIAWGQWFIGFETPAAWKSINMQGETTLHNIVGLQGKSEIFQLIFGFGGLLGILLSYYPRFEKIGSSILLLPWFIIIILYATLDLYNDFIPIQARFDYYINMTDELIELLIALASLLYIQLNSRKMSYSPVSKKSKL